MSTSDWLRYRGIRVPLKGACGLFWVDIRQIQELV